MLLLYAKGQSLHSSLGALFAWTDHAKVNGFGLICYINHQGLFTLFGSPGVAGAGARSHLPAAAASHQQSWNQPPVQPNLLNGTSSRIK